MPAGRPLKFKNKEDLQNKITEYFLVTPPEEIAITGLALFLDTTRETLCSYEEKDEFIDTIKRAKLTVEFAYEKRLIKNGNAGSIFALKNFGWKDKSEHEYQGGITINSVHYAGDDSVQLPAEILSTPVLESNGQREEQGNTDMA